MQVNMRIHRSLSGQQRGHKQLACMRGQLASYRNKQSSRLYSVSGSRVHGWHPPQQEQQLAPPHAVAAPEVLPATELEPEQQQQEGAAPHVPRNNAFVRRRSQERRVRMARDLGLGRTAAPGSNGSSSSSGWLELADVAAAPSSADHTEAIADVADAAFAPEAEAAPAPADRPEALPKGWAAAAAATAEDAAAAATAVYAGNGTTTYTFSTSSSSSSVRDSQPRIVDSAVGTAVDTEAAATATTAAANSAAATAAAANVASVEASWLYDQERQPLQVPQVQVVRVELARSPDGEEPAHFYMPDPLCIPCMCVEAGQQQEVLHQAYNRQLVAACWRQAGRVAVMDRDPEEEGVVLLGYEEGEHQIADLHQQAAAVTVSDAAVDIEAAVAAVASLASSSSSDGETDAAAAAAAGAAAATAAEAQQQPGQQLPQQGEVQPEMATVEFCFRCVTQPGERLWLAGDGEALGNWDAAKAAKMKWSEGHTWSVSLPFEQGAKVTYKAVLQLADKEPKYWRWQAGTNCAVEVRSSSDNKKPLKVKHDFK